MLQSILSTRVMKISTNIHAFMFFLFLHFREQCAMSWWIPHCCNQEAAHDPMSFFPSTILDAQCQAGIWIFSMPWLLRTYQLFLLTALGLHFDKGFCMIVIMSLEARCQL